MTDSLHALPAPTIQKRGVTVFVLSGSWDYEEPVVWGVFSSLEAAKAGAKPVIAKLGGRGRKHPYWIKDASPDDWHPCENAPKILELNVGKSGADLAITEHTLDASPV